MACFHPLQAWQTDSGEVVFVERGKIARTLELPCGQCVGCRLERSRQWAVRCMHESQMHEHNVFITLTYDDDHLPFDSSLNYRHFQLFLKRLRKLKGPFRYYMCGEYGELTARPHYHACLFGVFFEDRELYRELPSGSKIYTSKTLEGLWSFGYSSIGDVTFESAAYVARYIMKKVTGRNAEEHYKIVDDMTGEIYDRVPEFTRMSLKPGIGYTWFEKYKSEVYPHDRVIIRGREMKPPKYYDRLLALEAGDMSDMIEFDRYLKSLDSRENNSDDRLAVRETVVKAKLKSKLRGLE